MSEQKLGRPQALTEADVLEAIRKYATKSPTELAKKLGVSRRTIHRRLSQIPEERIEQIFTELAETELKPFQEEWDVWRQIPEVQEYALSLDKREVSEKVKKQLLRTLWYVSRYLKRHPKHFDIDECAELLVKVRTGQVKEKGLSYDGLRKAIRNWFLTKGISAELLTSKGISGEIGKGFGKFAHHRLTKEQRRRFIEALHEIVNSMSDYVLSLTWDLFPYWLYYTGTRIDASLKVRIEDFFVKSNRVWKARVVDKGRHKKGRITWVKICVGELREKIVRLLEARGNPEHGLLFEGLPPKHRIRKVFKRAYEKARIPKELVVQPCHIWRHTGAQDLLDATDWNYELVGSILGWKDTRTLKLCYGAMGETVKERGLRKAMGEPIEEVKKEFKF